MSLPANAGSPSSANPAPSGPEVDWQAYQRLLHFVQKAKSPYHRAASEYGLARLLHPQSLDRCVSGLDLADDLFRDGKRIQQRQSARFGPAADPTLLNTSALQSWPVEVDEAIATIRGAFAQLGSRARLALALNARGGVDEHEVRRLLGVGLRRYRDIVRESRETLAASPAVLDAYRTILDGIGGIRHERIALLVEELASMKPESEEVVV